MKIVATIYIPSDQPLAMPLARRMLARLRVAGYRGVIQIVEGLPSPCKDQWHIALGSFDELKWWLSASDETIGFGAGDWPAMEAFCDAHFPLMRRIHTVFSDQFEVGLRVLPGEYWVDAPQVGSLDLQMAPPEWALGRLLREEGLRLVIAESCTGGSLAGRLTDVPGASAYMDRAFVTYSNAAKQALLAVRPETLASQGAVSEMTALEMLSGALAHGDVALAITGIAGPGGGTEAKPVGTVCIAWGSADAMQVDTFFFGGDRLAIRYAAGNVAMGKLLELLHGPEC